MVRGTIWVLSMAVLMASLFLWIMMPTNTYRQKWLPSLRQKTDNSTYFGNQGSSLLTFTFPILLVAVLGCFYLHLGNKLNQTKMGKRRDRNQLSLRLAVWRRPMLVRGPLGIVSGVEFVFFLMFLALVIWSFSTYLHNRFAIINPTSSAKEGNSVWQSKLQSSALRLGLVGNIAVALLFYPVSRGSSMLPLFGLTSDASIKYHIWLGHIGMTLFTAHGILYVIYWAVTHRFSQMIDWSKTGVSNVAGEISLLAGLGLWVTTFPRIRRKMFELFFYTHHLYILFMFFFILHVGISYCCMMLPGFYLFLVDRYLRFLQSRHRVRLLSARVLPCDAVELNFSKSPGLKYNPTSIMFMNVPSVSKLQWHPFTVSSNSNLEEDKLSVIIKNEGSWSCQLYQMLSSPNPVRRVEVSIEGPYGPVSTDFLRHDSLVMISGGSGITPFISIIREFIYLEAELKCKTPSITLICIFKNSSDLTMLNLLLPIHGTPSHLSNLQLQIEAYVTREKEPGAATTDEPSWLKQPRTLWFNPDPTDAPISAILGTNSWFLLGAVITSSFIMFLVLIGIITNYYINPIDQNAHKFSSSWRSTINLLVMCVSICVSGSAGVMWNKRIHGCEVKQMNGLDGSSIPTAFPPGIENGDIKELESLSHQSLVQAARVHYGSRPDLKRMLFDCKGSSVGVLVCGPKKMRHDVAAICSSGLAKYLHFESISFSW